MGKPRIGDIEAAIIALLQTSATLSYIVDAQIRPADGGIDYENLEIVLGDLGILVQYDGGDYKATNHNQTAYAVDERFTLIVVAQNLRGAAAARTGVAGEKGVYDILEDLKAVIVIGRKLTVDTDKAVYLELLGPRVFENLFYKFGAAALGLQVRAHCSAWEYAT